MPSQNRVFLIGHVGQTPDVKRTESGLTIVNLSVATKDYQGKGKEPKTNWHRVKVFGKTADFVAKYAEKGAAVNVEGRLDYGKYTNKEGQEVYTTDVVADKVGVFKSGGSNETQYVPPSNASLDDVPF